METKIIKIDQDNLDHKLMQEAGDLIAAGELVAFPTETVYRGVRRTIRLSYTYQIFRIWSASQRQCRRMQGSFRMLSGRDLLP